jgi:hypothetical protein
MDTLYKIQKAELERHELYKKAGNSKASAADVARIQELTNQLMVLWDQHRREDAQRRWGASRSVAKKTDAA